MLAISFREQIVTAVVTTVLVVLFADITLVDLPTVAESPALSNVSTPLPEPRTPLRFIATAYCKGQTTRSGVRVRSGIAASDPSILPLGSIIRVSAAGDYDGLYTILDTGPAIQGRMIDIYIWSCYEALDFGRRPLDVTIVRLGWNPTDIEPERINEEFQRREKEWQPKHLFSRPLTLNDAPPR
tara:strand:- start:741 stop:1292 length:552 start_codon:yes stop_codon:yes gene_type:complete